MSYCAINLKPCPLLLEAVEYLVYEGYLYSTIDDDHHRSTDI